MAITITREEVKRKCMIPSSDMTYDSDIDSLIGEMQPSIEFTIADKYLSDTGNAKLQATLKLGILEILSGEFLQQLYREAGAAEELRAGGISIGARREYGVQLMGQGTARLRPFRKALDGLSAEAGMDSTTRDTDRTFTNDSMKVW